MGSLFARFAHDRSGSVLVYVGLSLPVMLALTALAVDFGHVYLERNRLQIAADAAALAGAAVLPDADDVVTEAREFAVANIPDAGGTTVLDEVDVEIGNWDGDAFTADELPLNAVRAVTKRAAANGNPLPTTFGALMGTNSFNLSRTAVAVNGGTQQACMLALDTDPSAIGVDFIGNPTVDLGGCVVASNSPGETSIRVGGSAAVTAPCIVAAGLTQTDEGLSLTECDEPTENAAPVSDPFDDLPEPPIPSEACRSVSTGTLNPGRYCGPTFNSGDYDLSPGIYVIDGGTLRINAGANVAGSDVVFFLTNNATVHFNGNATLDLSAPDGAAPASLEPYTGILFYSDRDNVGGENIFNGTADSQMTGALYSPSQPVRFNGNFSSDQCLQIVALRIQMGGTADFTNEDCAAAGLQSIPTSARLRLVL
ncbi:MAG: pilus assembly protein TadG-related protein [Solimonas sp.]